MKKLKLFFPLLGTSALAITPALSAQTPQLKNKNNLKTFNGHFSGMGPYGSAGNQDHAWANIGSITVKELLTIRFDVSTTSIAYINAHYIYGRGDSPGYAVYDFLTDAYPHGDFTEALYAVKINSDTPSITTIMDNFVFGKDGDGTGIGVHKDSKGTTLLNSHPEYMEITVNRHYFSTDTHWEWGINRPFSE